MLYGSMSFSTIRTGESTSFINYLQFISDMLGGDIFPLDVNCKDIRSIVSHSAIDYELILTIVLEIQQHNLAFRQADSLEAYPTLDALGKVRKQLHEHRGDIHQISLLDRIGELSVSFFNLTPDESTSDAERETAQLYTLSKNR